MTEHKFKYGKLPATYDHRDLLFTDFKKKGVKIKPAAIGFGMDRTKIPWSMFANDRVGDCAWASAAEETRIINHAAGIADVLFTDQNVLSDYSACMGYNPNDPNSDQGTDMRQEMNYRRHIGIVDAHGKRHKIYGYVALEPGNFLQALEALAVFDVVALGIEVPDYAEDQFYYHKTWTVRPGGAIVGGHAIPIVSRPTSTHIDTVTWAALQGMSSGFYAKYNDEAYAYITQESLNKLSKKTAEGYNWIDLQSAIKEI